MFFSRSGNFSYGFQNQPETYLRVHYGDFKEVEYTYFDATVARTRRHADVAGKVQMRVPPEGGPAPVISA